MLTHTPIYLDHNGTTPVDPRVAQAALPYWQEHFGNPSTRSPYGLRARAGLDKARQQVADFLGCQPAEIVWTSGATESNNWVIQGLLATRAERAHVITTAIEHPSILKTLDFLERQGRVDVTRLPVDRHGQVDPGSVADALQPHTVLVTVMHSNNEVGTLQPIQEIAAQLQGRVLFHSDAAQSAGKVPIDLRGVDLLSLAGHKMYAPKGVGVLYIRQGVRLEPLMFGAGHENGRRSGTENVAGAVAMGAACALVEATEFSRLASLRDRLQNRLQAELGERVVFNGHPSQRLSNTLSVNFVGFTGAEITARCPELAASTGPACHDGVVRLSHVLAAMGVDPEIGKGAVRLSLGRFTREQDVDLAAEHLIAAAAQSSRV